MKSLHLLAVPVAALAIAGCDADQGRNGGTASSEPIEAVPPPEGGDWSQVVTQTPEGGYMMGNPDADVKLVEFASMTCPACANFAKTGAEPLVDDYVKAGRVAFEFRNFVRDPLDITMALIARCGGPERFFPLTEAMFEDQSEFLESAQSVPVDQQQELAQLPPAQQFAGYARAAGLQQWAAQRGVPSARQQQCLTDQAEIDRLVQANSDAASQHNISGTPSFLINGELVDASSWDVLEPEIREALGR